MKYIVAVSGGGDSVVLLDMLAKSGEHELLVAHFDHGIRADSAEDARFVEALAKKYALPYFSRREELGEAASEERARARRYVFLRALAAEHQAVIVTAHHADDVIETIAINIQRGTGWRGLAVLGAKDVTRPLLNLTKQDIYNYALEHRLEWVEDSTNASDQYLRNRLRAKLATHLSEDAKAQLLTLWKTQTDLKKEIEQEVTQLMPKGESFSRYFFTTMPMDAALEVLRAVILGKTKKSLLSPQLQRGVLAIKTALPGATVQLGQGVELRFLRDSFIARLSEKML